MPKIFILYVYASTRILFETDFLQTNIVIKRCALLLKGPSKFCHFRLNICENTISHFVPLQEVNSSHISQFRIQLPEFPEIIQWRVNTKKADDRPQLLNMKHILIMNFVGSWKRPRNLITKYKSILSNLHSLVSYS
jgi:hypothetical protein